MSRNIYLLVFIFIFQILAYAPAQSMSNDEFASLCSKGTIEEVQNAIKAGADVNSRHSNNYTALMFVAGSQDPAIITELIKAGADVNAKDKEGKTALDYARENDNFRVVAELIKAGAK